MIKLTSNIISRAMASKKIAASAVVLSVLLGAIAFASIPGAGGVINGCYKKSGGTLRVIDSSSEQCAANETPISWSQTGPQGPQGPAGIEEGPAGGALDGMYPNPGIADSAVTTTEIKDFTVSMNDLSTGSVSAPKMIGGAAATNVWGNGQWAPVNVTLRGYTHIRRNIDLNNVDESGGFEAISYQVPLAPDDHINSHSIKKGGPVPDGCGGSYEQPEAAPGNLCVFYDPAYDAAEVAVLGAFSNRYGALLRVDQLNNDSGCYCAIADVTWAMKPPISR